MYDMMWWFKIIWKCDVWVMVRMWWMKWLQGRKYYIDMMLDAWENGFYDLVGNAIGELKYNDISPFDLERMIDSDYKGILKIILPIYKEYDRKLKQHGLLD